MDYNYEEKSPRMQRIKLSRKMQVETRKKMLKRLGNRMVTDADMERAATYLQKHRVATAMQMSKALEMKPIVIRMTLERLREKGIVGFNEKSSKIDEFFFR